MQITFYNSADSDKRKRLRSNATAPEQHLWSKLKARQLNGCKFRRQASIGRYIVDFYAPSHKLVIELDGESHFIGDAPKYDEERTAFLESLGLRVIRFTNVEVSQQRESVIERIMEILDGKR